jgi:membrane-associated protein
MPLLEMLIDFVLHLDQHLSIIIQDYGYLTYFLLFAIIFCETGLVLLPFLPGDSLLFAAGALTATTVLNLPVLFILLLLAAILGDTLNYWIGHHLGPRVFKHEKSWLFNKEYLDRTRRFYDAHGPKTIILARFVPIIRTFAPFVAGIGRMNYAQFLLYNVLGGFAWISLFVIGGRWFGTLPIVKNNFSLIIIGIIIISLVPVVIEIIRHFRQRKNTAQKAL